MLRACKVSILCLHASSWTLPTALKPEVCSQVCFIGCNVLIIISMMQSSLLVPSARPKHPTPAQTAGPLEDARRQDHPNPLQAQMHIRPNRLVSADLADSCKAWKIIWTRNCIMMTLTLVRISVLCDHHLLRYCSFLKAVQALK